MAEAGPRSAAEPPPELLKQDLFGRVDRVQAEDEDGHARTLVRRDTDAAPGWTRPLARWLARREARGLRAAAGVPGVPRLVGWDGRVLLRSWTEGRPMQRARPRDPAYFSEALRIVRRLHRAGVVHNDLAKEPNWLVDPDGAPVLIDFQLAMRFRHRGRTFRMLAREDIRHLLKHKRTYCPDRLTARQRALLASPAWPSRLWMQTGKRLYLFVTRRLLGWADREGAEDRAPR